MRRRSAKEPLKEVALAPLLIEVYGDKRGWAILHCPNCESDIHEHRREERCHMCGQLINWNSYVLIERL